MVRLFPDLWSHRVIYNLTHCHDVATGKKFIFGMRKFLKMALWKSPFGDWMLLFVAPGVSLDRLSKHHGHASENEACASDISEGHAFVPVEIWSHWDVSGVAIMGL
jgi:hypothetical protein